MNSAAPNWYPDPYGRFQQRYFDGTNWTAHVVDAAGTQSTDAAPLGGAAAGQQQAGGWSQQQPAQQQPAQQQPQQGQWGAQQYGQPQQPQPGSWGQPQQQPAQQFQQPQQQYGQPQAQQPGGGFGAPGAGQPASGGAPSSMTTKFVGVIIAGVGVLALIISLFALNWVSGDAAEETGGLDRYK